MEDDVLKLKEVVSVTFDTTPLLFPKVVFTQSTNSFE